MKCFAIVAVAVFATRSYGSDRLAAQIGASADGHYLTRPDGKPFFWLGDTGWAIFMRLNREETDRYLKDRAGKGFTVIHAVAMGGPFDRLDVPNRYGNLPLIDNDPTRPNQKYFEHIDWVVNRAAHYGLRIAMLPIWGAALIGGYLDDGTQKIFNASSAEAYGHWIAARYRDKGILWILGGDTNPIGVAASFVPDQARKPGDLTIVDYRSVYDAMAKGIIDGEGGRPFISYHLTCCSWPGTPPPRTSSYLGDRAWLTMNMIQSSHFKDPNVVMQWLGVSFAWKATHNYEAIVDEYYSRPTRPVIDGEPRYEALPIDVRYDPAKGYWTAYDSRNAAYHALFAGAAGHTFGNLSLHLSYDPGRNSNPGLKKIYPDLKLWSDELDSDGSKQMHHVKDLLLSRPYFIRIPDQSMLIDASDKGEEYVGATRGKDGSYAMIYSPKGREFTVDMSKITGSSAVGWWFDPRTGDAKKIETRFQTTGGAVFTPPSSGPENDWVLVVDDESRGFDAPGAMPRE